MVNWAHPPVRTTSNGVNASINLDAVICIACDEILLSTTSESGLSSRTENRIVFVIDSESNLYWSFDTKADHDSAIATLKRLGAWQ